MRSDLIVSLNLNVLGDLLACISRRLRSEAIINPLTNSQASAPKTSSALCPALITALTAVTLLVHGYHPFVEDGGIYAAGVMYRLDPSLFPHDAAFAAAQNAYSAFGILLASLVRVSGLPLDWVLFLSHLGCIWVVLFAAWKLTARSFHSQYAPVFAALTMSALFTVPIAGTSLYLMEPYLTARSFSTPLSLLALIFMLEAAESCTVALRLRSSLLGMSCLLVGAFLHPLMVAYAMLLIVACICFLEADASRRWLVWITSTSGALLLTWMTNIAATPETQAVLAANASRTYWFLATWRWFEWVGLLAPLVIFAGLNRLCKSLKKSGRAVCHAGVMVACNTVLIALVFARADASSQSVARLQPLRMFLVLYAVMAVLLGGLLGEFVAVNARHFQTRALMAASVITALMVAAYLGQRQMVRSSNHLEFPGRKVVNPWAQAFLWTRSHTPPGSLIALDADYITTPGEDAQVFRALAQRSMLCDFSKDGGVASIRPNLAETWLAQSSAETGLSKLPDTTRDERLRPFGVTWMVLHADAGTAHACPYKNGTVKVCSLAE